MAEAANSNEGFFKGCYENQTKMSMMLGAGSTLIGLVMMPYLSRSQFLNNHGIDTAPGEYLTRAWITDAALLAIGCAFIYLALHLWQRSQEIAAEVKSNSLDPQQSYEEVKCNIGKKDKAILVGGSALMLSGISSVGLSSDDPVTQFTQTQPAAMLISAFAAVALIAFGFYCYYRHKVDPVIEILLEQQGKGAAPSGDRYPLEP